MKSSLNRHRVSRPYSPTAKRSFRGRRLRIEPLEERQMLDCTVPVTKVVRTDTVTFDQCYEREFTHDGDDYVIHTFYTEVAGAHGLPDVDDAAGDNVEAVAMTDETELAFRFYLDRNLDFLPDGVNTLDVYIAEDSGTGGAPDATSLTIDDEYIVGYPLGRRLLAFHEMQHLVQRQYDTSPDWNFYGEAISRAIEDRVDPGLDADAFQFFMRDVGDFLGNDAARASDVTTISYKGFLWWTWVMDQYRDGPGIDPPVTGASDLGWDALRDFYLELESQPTDQLGALGDFIAGQGGSFRDDFIDYTLALYAYQYNPADPRLGFLDAEISATGGISGHTKIGGSPVLTTASPAMNPRSSRYWEFTSPGASDYISLTFDGRGKDFGFSVMTVDGGTLADRWTSYSDTFALTVHTRDLDRMVGVVTAFDQAGTVDVSYAAVRPTVRIKDPTAAVPKMVGLADDPRSFLVRLQVNGRNGSPVAGLSSDEFDVTLNRVGGGPGIPATIITAAYVQNEYWLLVRAPDEADGTEDGAAYDLTVALATNSNTQSEAIVYEEEVQDVQIILDRSFSMAIGSGKLEAAQRAADLMINELSDADQGGFIAFSRDADLRVSLDTVGDGSQRSDLANAVAAESVDTSTSIGDGLRTALNDYQDNHIDANAGSFVLLSDGHENEPEMWADVKDDIQAAGVTVHTVSFGPGANELLMQEIADTVDGGHHYAPESGNIPINSTLSWQNNLSRVYDNIATQIAGRQRVFTALADSAVGGVSTGIVDFEDLPPDGTFRIGDEFVASGVSVVTQPLILSDGTQVLSGTAQVGDAQMAPGSGQEMKLTDINLNFRFARPLTGLSLRFGVGEGNLYNIRVNGGLIKFGPFSKINEKSLRGVDFSMEWLPQYPHQGRVGLLTLRGDIDADSFAIGGDELWIDSLEFQGQEGNLHEIPVDETADQLVVAVAWQSPFSNTFTTRLLDPSGKAVSDAYLRRSSLGTNHVWDVPDPVAGSYWLRVNDLREEYFVTASLQSRYELRPFLDLGHDEATQGVEVPILAIFTGDDGPILDATVTAQVTNPDNARRTLTLYDDGNHGDGRPDDGVYANVYTTTAWGDIKGAVNVIEGREPWVVGSYGVRWTAIKGPIRREAEESFVIARDVDSDGDTLPDSWENAHGLDPNDDRDAGLDPDMDWLPNYWEFRLGTDPNNSDTDGGGEADGSEMAHLWRYQEREDAGMDPLDPSDDRIGPLSGVIVTAEADWDGPYNQITVGGLEKGDWVWYDLYRREFDPQGNGDDRWQMMEYQTRELTFVDRQVYPGWSYQYLVAAEGNSSSQARSNFIDFEDVDPGKTVKVGQQMVASGIAISGLPLIRGDGTSIEDGFAQIHQANLAGGSGQEMKLQDITLEFHLPPSLTSLSLLFGVAGGNLYNIELNGGLSKFSDFDKIDGSNFRGVNRSVQWFSDTHGRLTLQGEIDSFSIGGDELFIDDIIVQGTLLARLEEGQLVEASEDPYAPVGSILINEGWPVAPEPHVVLELSADDMWGEHDAQHLEVPVPFTPTDLLMMRISDTPDFSNAPWRPFQPQIDWELAPGEPGDVRAVYAQFKDEAGNISRTAVDTIRLPSEIVGRYVFYNDSAFDGNDPRANAADDGAIAPGKTPLFHNQQPGPANLTSYDAGINGIMIDIVGMPEDAVLSSSDFSFSMGDVSDPSSWQFAPAPTEITVRRGAGEGGSDRISMVWETGAVTKQWLAVGWNWNTYTGGSSTFFFGNMPGDANLSGATDLSDFNIWNAEKFTQVRIDSPADFDRSGTVDLSDFNIWNANKFTVISAPPPAHDAVLEQAIEQESTNLAASLGQFEWLYDLEQVKAKERSPDNGRLVEETVDRLLATYWP